MERVSQVQPFGNESVTNRYCFAKPKVCCMFVLMHPVAYIEQRFVNELASLYDAGEARQLYSLLLEERLGWSRRDYLIRKHEHLPEQDVDWLLDTLSSLKKAMPIQYILGYAWFMGMRLAVNESVLIPRPETEELVHLIISGHQAAGSMPRRIIDIGTGSGCISIALKKAFPDSSVYALDISAAALRVAKQNADAQSAAINFINADVLEWDVIFQEGQVFDIVVSNPPYITANEQHDMHPNVLSHEPHQALFVDTSTPLLFYEHIAAFAQKHLHPNGDLYFEINRSYGQAVCDLLYKKGFQHVSLHQDMQQADRMIHATMSNN
ncbi:release factor glutamine methyltransferase [Parapedobacter luteus]|uniref:peptide chain release factor N(5)-glutamine methyltransferase n=1 Tax=Parapedobacter luteus TaxID=623280 RepID=A0A1T5F105_9SPHI|nr:MULTISPECIES: peptide chain release factor N(5)-glutamine methyltransferase [Parapedobacter]SKB89851.1 release factor glutamine methyltransferase [Parapedobacter luteus]